MPVPDDDKNGINQTYLNYQNHLHASGPLILMIRCYCAANLLEAHMIRDLLEEAGIKTHVFNENAQGGVGEIPFIHTYPEIWLVNEGDIEKARKILAAYETPMKDTATRLCGHCGELNPGGFQICWNCGKTLQ